MRGFKLYVSNTTEIPPNGYLCNENSVNDTDPNTTQTISCNQLGEYVIYYDDMGSYNNQKYYPPIIELCYVAITGKLNINMSLAHEVIHKWTLEIVKPWTTKLTSC